MSLVSLYSALDKALGAPVCLRVRVQLQTYKNFGRKILGTYRMYSDKGRETIFEISIRCNHADALFNVQHGNIR